MCPEGAQESTPTGLQTESGWGQETGHLATHPQGDKEALAGGGADCSRGREGRPQRTREGRQREGGGRGGRNTEQGPVAGLRGSPAEVRQGAPFTVGGRGPCGGSYRDTGQAGHCPGQPSGREGGPSSAGSLVPAEGRGPPTCSPDTFPLSSGRTPLGEGTPPRV